MRGGAAEVFQWFLPHSEKNYRLNCGILHGSGFSVCSF